jgi:hypothetical protein
MKLVKILVALVILSMIFNLEFPVLVQANTNFGTGPGGVASKDGTSDLVLWLDANTLSGDDGFFVGNWPDKSGWGNNASQTNSGNQPSLETLELNGQSVVRFDGYPDLRLGDWLKISDSDELDNTAGLTIFTVINPAIIDYSERGILSKRVHWKENSSYTLFFHNGQCANPNCLLIDIDNNTSPNRFTSDPFTFTTNTPSQVSVLYDGSLLSTKLMVNATTQAILPVNSPSIPNYDSNLTLGTMNEGYTTQVKYPPFYKGDIAEVIIFRKALSSSEYLLIENYLSSKYDIDIAASGIDRYQGDTPINGDFDLDVAGIGKEFDGSNLTAASAGMIVKNKTFLADNGDYLLFGHKTLQNSLMTEDLPWDLNTYSNARRWSRYWHIDATDITTTTNGLVDIYFDYSDAGLSAFPINNETAYKLLTRTSSSETFSELAYPASTSGDQIIFSDISVSDLGSYVTLGTLNSNLSDTYFTFNVDKDGFGSGTVFSNPNGIECGTDCSEDFLYNTVVTLTASADYGSVFSNWNGDCSGSGDCIITIDNVKSVTASFSPEFYGYLPIIANSTSND